MTKTNTNLYRQSGNVLFLILIAVVLFAALSYAVTQSTRSGGGDVNSETNLVSSASLTQYPASVRTSIIRMLVTKNVEAEELEFDAPATFDAGSTTLGVFHPSAGGASFIKAPADVMRDGLQAEWVFSSDYNIENIGTTANDIIALLPGVSPAICKKINSELGITGGTDGDSDGVPTGGASTLPVFATHSMNAANTGIGTAATGTATFEIDGIFSGEAFGCYDQDDSDADADSLVYYHVLIER